MAWNEPGGNRNKQDPWRGSGQDNNGPPDLDEFLKGLQSKLSGFFGGRNGNRRDGPRGGAANGGGMNLVLILLLIAGVVWGVNGIYRVEQAERAVVLRFGKYLTQKTAGLHWYPPLIDEVLTLDTELVSGYTHQATMLTEDQNIVDVQLEVQYRVDDARKFFLNINDPLAALRQATESALRHVVGGSLMDSVITEGRAVLANDVETRLQSYLDIYNTGLVVLSVTMRDAHPPVAVKEAFDNVISAKEDEERLKNEADAYANSVIPEARGMAARIREEAIAYKTEVEEQAEGATARFTKLLEVYKLAPEIMRHRLYIETIESVLANSSKVLMAVDGSQNLTYLPLDKLMSAAPTTNSDFRVLPQRSTLPSSSSDSALSSESIDPRSRSFGRGEGR
ncbi:MAG: FtsH protease activity modulator HflK [Gammaproteobacteria bacterium]